MNKAALANLKELKEWDGFIQRFIGLNAALGLPARVESSKRWEYPWLWHNGLAGALPGAEVLDIGSGETAPPWAMVFLGGAKYVRMVETSDVVTRNNRIWSEAKNLLPQVSWSSVEDEILPFSDSSFDIITSFSVIEHQPDKKKAIDEVIRVLRPGGLFAFSFDVQNNGRCPFAALTLEQFHDLVWTRPEFRNTSPVKWNVDDWEDYVEWHKSFAGCDYGTGAALLKKVWMPSSS